MVIDPNKSINAKLLDEQIQAALGHPLRFQALADAEICHSLTVTNLDGSELAPSDQIQVMGLVDAHVASNLSATQLAEQQAALDAQARAPLKAAAIADMSHQMTDLLAQQPQDAIFINTGRTYAIKAGVYPDWDTAVANITTVAQAASVVRASLDAQFTLDQRKRLEWLLSAIVKALVGAAANQ